MANIENKNFAYDEMMVHIPLCSHKHIDKVLVVGEVSAEFEAELDKHKIEQIVYVNDLNIEGEFNIILYNKECPNKEQLALLNRLLEPTKGILVTKASFIFRDIEKSKDELSRVGDNFWICMPYTFGHNTLIFASKKYHPQAEIVLQVSDLLENCNYYNTELHNSCFVHPNYIHKAITGIEKR